MRRHPRQGKLGVRLHLARHAGAQVSRMDWTRRSTWLDPGPAPQAGPITMFWTDA